MTLRRPQLRLRSLLIVVLLIATAFGVTREIIRRRRLAEEQRWLATRYRSVATIHAEDVKMWKETLDMHERTADFLTRDLARTESLMSMGVDKATFDWLRSHLSSIREEQAENVEAARKTRALHQYFVSLVRKYNEAAVHPERPLPPDPPMPPFP